MANSSVNELDRILLVRGAMMQPVYAKVRTASDLFGIARTELFHLMATGKIDYLHYRRPGAEKGIRLVNLQSLRAFLETFKVS